VAAGTPAIRALGLVQRYGVRRALGPLDLELGVGERLAVLGDNGAGKSTLLRVLATRARPAEGTLELGGREAFRHRDVVRPRLAYLAHQPGLTPILTARENLVFFCRLQAVPLGRVDAVLDEVDLSQEAARTPTQELSRGMQQRLAVARTLLGDPELLLLDEPDASLDAGGRRLLDSVVEGRAVVLATHDRPLARRLCDRALLLVGGRPAGDPWALQVLDRTQEEDA
jgi:heme ABC exporter ATP-binding subunit CcmA